jgi:hypothetical protein
MKAYVLTTGIVFALIVAAHVARVFAEGPRLLKEPSFVVTSLIAVLLVAWARRTFRQLPRPEKNT